jgi:hypothetical protein
MIRSERTPLRYFFSINFEIAKIVRKTVETAKIKSQISEKKMDGEPFEKIVEIAKQKETKSR